jgi:UDP-glucose 4-epimerase
MVVPRFVRAALLNNSLHVFGDGSQTRVFCHVSDTVNAILSLVDNDLSVGEVFNIGGTFEISITDLAKFIVNQTNSSSNIEFVGYSEAYGQGFEETFKRIPNIEKINKFTGWKPTKSLTQIISDIVTELN